VPNIALSWQASAVVAVCCVLVALAAARVAPTDRAALARLLLKRRALTVASFGGEVGIILGLYALWQVAGGLSLGHIGEAITRGRDLWRIEREWHFPNETSLQNLIIHHPLLVQICNIYYATMHFGMLMAVLLWLYLRHRDAYRRTRTLIVLTTSACLFVGMVPVAPPRLVNVGMVDTAAAYHQSVYAVTAQIGADQYSAMPSVHVAWAGLVAIAVITATRSRWRWLILVHTAATLYVVAATANHFWLDGVVALGLLGISLAVQEISRHIYFRYRLFGRRASETAMPDADVLALRDTSPSR
jgi:hypothetical protein